MLFSLRQDPPVSCLVAAVGHCTAVMSALAVLACHRALTSSQAAGCSVHPAGRTRLNHPASAAQVPARLQAAPQVDGPGPSSQMRGTQGLLSHMPVDPAPLQHSRL